MTGMIMLHSFYNFPDSKSLVSVLARKETLGDLLPCRQDCKMHLVDAAKDNLPREVHWPAWQQLHDLILSEATSRLSALHEVGTTLIGIFDIGQTKGTATVLVAGELGNRGSGIVWRVEFDNTSATRASVGLVLNLGTFDLADGREELDEILVACGPGKLCRLARVLQGKWGKTLHCGRK